MQSLLWRATALRRRLGGRDVGLTFGVLVALPLALALLELVAADLVPDGVASTIAPAFTLLVYLPVVVVGALVIEPLGGERALDAIPYGSAAAMLLALLVAYYAVAVVLVNAASFLRGLARAFVARE